MTKYDKYNDIKNKLSTFAIIVDDYDEINYGIQFSIYFHDCKELLRIYESKKKGITLDFSQFKSECNREFISSLNNNIDSSTNNFYNSEFTQPKLTANISNLNLSDNLLNIYLKIENILIKNSIKISDLRKINYGLQINIIFSDNDIELLRIYESSKTGVRFDYSQFKNKSYEILLKSFDIQEDSVIASQENIVFNKSIKNNTLTSKTKDSEKVTKKYIYEKINTLEFQNKVLIGTDESGKGDFFGPLVIAGVYADLNQQKILTNLGIMDSKKLSDKKIRVLAEQIKNICPYSVVVIGNKRYNEMYEHNKNINKILAWGHARVIENLLENIDCSDVLADQFGNPKYIEDALMKQGKNITLHQKTKAEQNIVVAAASILARERFIIEIDKMCDTYGIHFYKGASNKTIESARLYVNKYDFKSLNLISKTNFKTIDKI